MTPRTLGDYRDLFALMTGDDSAPVLFLDEKIAQSPHGAAEKVIADESQMLMLLASMLGKEANHDDRGSGRTDI